MKDDQNYQQVILESLNANFSDDKLNVNAVLDYYYKFLPQIKVYSSISGKYTLYSTRKKLFSDWLIKNKNKIKKALTETSQIAELYELFFRPIKYKNVKFFLGSHNSNKGQWLVCNESSKDVEIIKFKETNEGLELVKTILKSKETQKYIQKSLIRLSDGSIISLHYKISYIFKTLVDSHYYVNYKGELLLNQRDYSLKNWASFCNPNNVINPYNHYENLQDLDFYEPVIHNKTFTIGVEFCNIESFLTVNKNKPLESKQYLDTVFFMLEQLFNDIFTSRNSSFTSVRRPVRNDFRLYQGFDVSRVNEEDITNNILNKINEFIFKSEEYLEYTSGKIIKKNYTNKYFRKLIKIIKKIKIKGKGDVKIRFALSALNKEQKKFRTPYNLILNFGRGPNIEAIPNTASIAICDVILNNLEIDKIGVEENTSDLIKVNKKIAKKITYTEKKDFGPMAKTTINFDSFSNNLV